MAPSERSVTEYFKVHGGHTNFYYYSDLDKRIKADGKEIDIWCHGHMHCHNDYMLENVRVLSNARGYVGYETMQNWPGFQPDFRIEL
jgi:hypothetical protein